MSSQSRGDAVLAAWTTLEVLTPQTVPDSDALSAMGRQLVRLAEDPEPWTLPKNRPQTKDKTIFWFVYLGLLDLNAATRSLLDIFPDEFAEERSYVRGEAPLAVIVLDLEGRPLPGKTFLASFPWGYGRVRANALRELAEFSSLEPEWRARIEKELIEYDDVGKPCPVTPERLQHLTSWLIQELNVPEEEVDLNGIAVRVVQSTATPDPPEPELLNSFFLEDLATARRAVRTRDAGAALRRYLGIEPSPRRRDIVSDLALLEQTLNPAGIPLARWPVRKRHPLSLMQQAAVNHVVADLRVEGIAGINGPPGTGKTTLLRDIVAKVVLDRATALARFKQPDDAFIASGRMPLGKGYADLSSLHASLLGHEIVVASSNNKAVENVSVEIPSMEAIAEDFVPPLRYFHSIADCVATDEGEPIEAGKAWGLAAAVLGKSANKTAFANQFWWHRTRGFGTYLNFVSKGWSESDNPPEVLTLEEAPHSKEEALERWKVAKRAFGEARLRVEKISKDLSAAYTALGEHDAAAARVQQAAAVLAAALGEQEINRRQLTELENALAAAKEAVKGLRSDRDALLAMKPGFFSRLFRTRRYRAWLVNAASAAKRVDEALQAAAHALRARDAAASTATEIAARASRAQQLKELSEHALQTLAQALNRGRELAGAQFPDRAFWSREESTLQLSSPWLGEAFQDARDDLFVAAFALHRGFIDASAQSLRHNLAAAIQLLRTRSLPPQYESLRRSLWASLFLVVPVVSTTFASVTRLFGPLGREQLGWLLIDEAGQATPQAAVGAMYRASRVISIGDPLQIEPVVQVPPRLVAAIFKEYDLPSEEWAAPRMSVQGLADRTSWLGTTIQRLDGDLWVGSPLRVHRRCRELMFSVSNRIAYQGLMVFGTPRRPSPIGDVLGPSAWLSVEGNSESKWSPDEGETAVELLARLLDSGIQNPDIFLITPFRVVASGLRDAVLKNPAITARLPKPHEWVWDHIGTVHTFQGKEAEAVILVLGAPSPAAAGARNWAGDPPNLLNVAVSRAQERLYVIGARSVWKRAGAFTTLHTSLP